MKNLLRKSFFVFIIAAVTVPAFARSIITEWNPIIINGTVGNTPQPTIGTRTMSMVFTSAYEAWSAYNSVALGLVGGNTLDGTGGVGSEENINKAVSYAIYTTLLSVAPNTKAEYDAFMASKGYALDDNTPPAALGKAAAQLVIDSRRNDGSNAENGYADTTGYQPQPPSDPDAWQPLRVPLTDPNATNVQRPLTPHWGRVKTFAINVADYRLSAPAAPGTERWDAQIQQLIDINANLTNEQKVIAEFWRPQRGTPPMLWGELAVEVSNKYNYSLEQDVKLYFIMHNAMLDASITCWENKYFYDYLRPVTAIRNLGNMPIRGWGGPGIGTIDILASQWLPYQSADQPTPPFPEYASGHSTFGGSWAEVMKLFTGSDEYGYGRTFTTLAFEGTPLDPPVVLHWDTYTEAAQEAGMSRLYGGIHFMDANLNAQAAGRLVGAAVFEKAQALFNGHTTSNVDGWNTYR